MDKTRLIEYVVRAIRLARSLAVNESSPPGKRGDGKRILRAGAFPWGHDGGGACGFDDLASSSKGFTWVWVMEALAPRIHHMCTHNDQQHSFCDEVRHEDPDDVDLDNKD